MASTTTHIGTLGEKAATKWLRNQGFLIRDLNWRAGRYELDIVAERWDVTHFIEVKTRKAYGLTTPEEAITPDKFKSLARAACAYIAQHNIQNETQFDLVAVDVLINGELKIRLIENAMEFRW